MCIRDRVYSTAEIDRLSGAAEGDSDRLKWAKVTEIARCGGSAIAGRGQIERRQQSAGCIWATPHIDHARGVCGTVKERKAGGETARNIHRGRRPRKEEQASRRRWLSMEVAAPTAIFF